MIKLIVSDMDGTLLNSNDVFDTAFWEMFKELKNRGIYFSIASGRQYPALIKKFKQIKEDIILISENGAYIVLDDTEFLASALKKEDIDSLIDKGRELDDAFTVLSGKNAAYVESHSKQLIDEMTQFFASFEIVDDLKSVNDTIFKVSYLDFTGAENNSFKKINIENKNLKKILSSEYWIDIMKTTINKGTALQKVQDLLDISEEETMTFGDYLNDIELLQNSKHSHAMKEAHPELKKIANHVIGSNDDHSVIKVINEKILNKI